MSQTVPAYVAGNAMPFAAGTRPGDRRPTGTISFAPPPGPSMGEGKFSSSVRKPVAGSV